MTNAAVESRGAAVRGRGAKKCGALMDAGALEAVWRDGRCPHRKPIAGMYALCMALSCRDCGVNMEFLMKFGHPRTFDVSVEDGDRWHVGRASVRAVKEFVLGSAVKTVTPGGANSTTPKMDSRMFTILKNDLGMGGQKACPVADFLGAWRDIDCRHRLAACVAAGDELTVDCQDCSSAMVFRVDGGRFDVGVSLRGAPLVGYGLHEADAVVRAVRETSEKVFVPGVMADKMSYDPDCEARRIASLTSLLVRHGLLRRVERDDLRYGAVVRKINAASCTRRSFRRLSGSMAAAVRAVNGEQAGPGKEVEAWQLEVLRLMWPHWFEGVGVTVIEYDPAGTSEYCVRCHFSTLDDGTAGADAWSRGCPECGYGGYLLDLD